MPVFPIFGNVSAYSILCTMANSRYIPNSDQGMLNWLKNFSATFATYAQQFGFGQQVVDSVKNDLSAFEYILELLEVFKSETKERTAYKEILKNGPLGAPLGNFPTLNELPPVPAVVPAGLIPRISSIVKRIKAHPLYTEAIGQDLGVVASALSASGQQSDSAKPQLSLTKMAGKIRIKYIKGKFQGIQLFSRRGSEKDFSLLANVTLTSYDDTRLNLQTGTPETREYYACYLLKDQLVGLNSDVVSEVV